MSFDALLTQTVTVVNYGDGTRNAHGNPARTESSRSDHPARLRQLSSKEEGAVRDVVTGLWRLIVPADVPLSEGSEVLHGVQRFTVEGAPARVEGRHGTHHIESLLRYEGDVT